MDALRFVRVVLQAIVIYLVARLCAVGVPIRTWTRRRSIHANHRRVFRGIEVAVFLSVAVDAIVAIVDELIALNATVYFLVAMLAKRAIRRVQAIAP
jgi:uncharacterized protein (DUF2384 family)